MRIWLWSWMLFSWACSGLMEPAVAADAVGQPVGEATTLDCRGHSWECPALVIRGENIQESLFRGLADPSVREDPVSGRLWLAYSWPNVTALGTTAVQLRLARSDDQGETWTHDSILFSNPLIRNPVTGRMNYVSNEVIDLWPATSHIWYSVRLVYLIEPGRSIYAQNSSWHFRVSRALSPRDIPDAADARLGFGNTDDRYGVDVSLPALSPELEGCALFNEPSIITTGGAVYLAAQCLWSSNGVLQPQSDFYALFTTWAEGPPATWQWRYVGKLAGPAEARELENHEKWVQLNLSKGPDGTFRAVLTPADFDASLQMDVHHGCRVLELISLDPPVWRRDPANGQLVTLATITSSDNPYPGPAACAYDPASSTGVLMTRRPSMGRPAGWAWMIYRTGLRP